MIMTFNYIICVILFHPDTTDNDRRIPSSFSMLVDGFRTITKRGTRHYISIGLKNLNSLSIIIRTFYVLLVLKHVFCPGIS